MKEYCCERCRKKSFSAGDLVACPDCRGPLREAADDFVSRPKAVNRLDGWPVLTHERVFK